MMQHRWSVVCEKAIIDAFSNTLSVINCIEQINTSILPAQFSVGFASCWDREDLNDKSKITLHVRLLHRDHEGKETELFSPPPLEVTTGRQRIVSNIPNLVFTRDGIHHIVVQRKLGSAWKTETEIPLQVIYVTDSEKQD